MSESSPQARTPEVTAALLSGGPLARWLAPSRESRVERIAVSAIRARPVADDGDGDPASFAALRASIEARGVVEPLLLRPGPADSFTVVCGARRLRVARYLGLTTVPAIVRELDDVGLLITGAWQALLRAGVGPAGAGDLERRLVAGGLLAAEAAALVAAIPRTSGAPASVPVQPADSTVIPLRFLNPRVLSRRRAPAGWTTPCLPPPEGLVLPVEARALALLGELPLPSFAAGVAA
jgi:hypothetical protein